MASGSSAPSAPAGGGCGHAPGSGAACNHGPVANHYARPAPSGAVATADMRDGDADSGSVAPPQPATTVPATAATMARRGSGTP